MADMALLLAMLWFNATVEQAMRLVSEGRLPEAEAMLREVIRQSPADADARFRLGLVFFKQRKLDDAEREIATAVRQEPKALVAWRALALVRAARRDGIGEAQALEKIIELAPTDPAPYRKLAALLLEHRTAEGALAIAQSGVKRFPKDAELLRLEGLACYGAGKKAEAIAAFLAAMDAAPDSGEVHASIETLLPDAGDQLPAIRERLLRYQQRKPDSPLAPFLLAMAGEDREPQLRTAIAMDASFWPAHFELGRLLRDQGKFDDAASAFETVLRLHPDHEAAHFALAQIYTERGDREKAAAHRFEHHRLRIRTAEAERKRSASAPRMKVIVR